MQRIKCLGRYQKIVLLFMAAVVLVFSILYPITIEREGFEYKDAILVPNLENGNTVYSGKIQGKQASFTASPAPALASCHIRLKICSRSGSFHPLFTISLLALRQLLGKSCTFASS